MKRFKRKDFLKYAGLGVGGAVLGTGLVGCGNGADEEGATNSNGADFGETFEWRIQTHWAEGLEYFKLYERFCQYVKEASGGQLNITPYGPGEIVSTGDELESVGGGTLEMAWLWPAYWIGQLPVAGHLNGQLFGWQNYQDMWTFLFEMGAFEIIQKAYDDFNVHLLSPYSAGSLVMFTKDPVKTLDDWDGMPIRSTGIPAEVFEMAGASPTFISGDELYSSLETGVVEGAHWGSVGAGWEMGFHEVTDYIIQPSMGITNGEIFVNNDAWNQLPEHLKHVLYTSARRASIDAHAWFYMDDFRRMETFVEEGYGEIVHMEQDAVDQMLDYSLEVVDMYSEEDPEYCGEVGEMLKKYLRKTGRI